MKVSLCCDHGGLALKNSVKDYLLKNGYEVCDYGTDSLASCDYPDFALPAAKAIQSGACAMGIFICTTGIGMSMCANKVKGVRCALCHDLLSARLTREHNNANALALGAGVTGSNLALEIVKTFLNTPFSEEARHQRRVDKIAQIEANN